jgi:hypothetical protein
MLAQYHLAVMAGLLVLLFLLSRKTRGGKFLLLLMALLAASIGYELITGRPVSEIPQRVNQALNQPPPAESTNPHYYQVPEEAEKLLHDK